jgi:acyl-CoA thioester hydrolase
MSDNIISVVAALIRDDAGRMLVVRKRGTEAFMQPGGKCDAGEDDLTALDREIGEELGCRMVPGSARPLGQFDCAAANEPGWRVRANLYAVDVRRRGAASRDRRSLVDRSDRAGVDCSGAADPRSCSAARIRRASVMVEQMLQPLLDGVIRDGRHHMQIRVYYEDTDFSGIVYHANYLRFMERGRTNHLRLMGAGQHALFAEAQAESPGFAFVVRSMQIDFFKSARMDDVLDVVTWPVAVKGASITLAQEVRRGENVLVKAQVRVAFISEGRAQPIPKALRILMKADQI